MSEALDDLDFVIAQEVDVRLQCAFKVFGGVGGGAGHRTLANTASDGDGQVVAKRVGNDAANKSLLDPRRRKAHHSHLVRGSATGEERPHLPPWIGRHNGGDSKEGRHHHDARLEQLHNTLDKINNT